MSEAKPAWTTQPNNPRHIRANDLPIAVFAATVDAKRCLLAVNAHDDLVKAVHELLAYHGAGTEGDELDQRLIADLRSALAKARGE